MIYCGERERKEKDGRNKVTQSFSTNLSGKYFGILTEFVVGRSTWQVTVENQFLESNDLYLDSREYYAAELREWATGSRALSAGALPKNRPLFGRKKRTSIYKLRPTLVRFNFSFNKLPISRLEKIDKNIQRNKEVRKKFLYSFRRNLIPFVPRIYRNNTWNESPLS